MGVIIVFVVEVLKRACLPSFLVVFGVLLVVDQAMAEIAPRVASAVRCAFALAQTSKHTDPHPAEQKKNLEKYLMIGPQVLMNIYANSVGSFQHSIGGYCVAKKSRIVENYVVYPMWTMMQLSPLLMVLLSILEKEFLLVDNES